MQRDSESIEPVEPLAVSAVRAASLLGISRSKTYELMSLGQLPYLKIGRCRRILLADLRRLVERLRTEV